MRTMGEAQDVGSEHPSLAFKKELLRFAQDVLVNQLSQFAERIRENTREDLVEIVGNLREDDGAVWVNARREVEEEDDPEKKILKNVCDLPEESSHIHKFDQTGRSMPLPLAFDKVVPGLERQLPMPSNAKSTPNMLPARVTEGPSHASLDAPSSLFTHDAATPKLSQKKVFKHDPLLSSCHDANRGYLSNLLRPIVASSRFDIFVSLVIVLNGAFIGISTDYMAKNLLSETPVAFDVIEIVFLTIFVIEVALRFGVLGCDLFRKQVRGIPNDQRNWNLFDFGIIGLQLMERSFRQYEVEAHLGRISMLRTLRLLKLLRAIRLIKVVRFVNDLRTIAISVYRSLSIFFYAVAALSLVIFVFATYFVQTCLDARLSGGVSEDDIRRLEQRFGSMYEGMYTLYLAITGGIDWVDIRNDLSSVESWVHGEFALGLYIAFVTIALMNVIIGVFLERAMEMAKQEREIYLVSIAKDVFREADYDHTGVVSYADFKNILANEEVQLFFDAVDLEASEAKILFNLLDVSNDGIITADEFLKGCVRLRGPAKALDLLKLSRQVMMRLDAQDKHIEQQTGRNRQAILQSAMQNRQYLQGRVHEEVSEVNERLEVEPFSSPAPTSSLAALELPGSSISQEERPHGPGGSS